MAAIWAMVRGEGRGFDVKRQLKLSAWPVLAALLVTYFGYHLLQGNRGLLAQARIEGKLATARAELARTEAARQQREQRVNGLRPESLDRDLLEERARLLLNMGAPGEMVVLNDQLPAGAEAPPVAQTIR